MIGWLTGLKAWAAGARVWIYAAVAAAFAALFGYAKLEEHEKRKAQDEAAAQKAEQEAADAKAQLNRVEVRDEVQSEIQKMPAPPVDPQPVATAPADTSAGRLRDEWSRDEVSGK